MPKRRAASVTLRPLAKRKKRRMAPNGDGRCIDISALHEEDSKGIGVYDGAERLHLGA
jgi:hypothetical protein